MYVYIYIYIYIPGHRVSRPPGTGSVGDSVGEGVRIQGFRYICFVVRDT